MARRKTQAKFKLWSVMGLGAFLWLVQPGNEEMQGRVVAVQDGDTVTLLTRDKAQIRVRLQGIDAPESRQPFGVASKQSLSDLVFGKDVRVVVSGKDRYGRTLGDVDVGDVWVNREQVARGLAWHYHQYSSDLRLSGAEAGARQARRGLWQDARPIPPWQWRREPHGQQRVPQQPGNARLR